MADKAEPGQGAATVTPIKPRTRRDSRNPVLKAAAAAKAKADAEALAGQLTMMANTLAMTLLGPEAAMNDTEKVMIDIGLPPVLEKLSPEQATKFVTLANPMILLFGVGVWGLRLATLAESKVKAAKAVKVSAVPAPATLPTENVYSEPDESDPGYIVKESSTEFGVPDARTDIMEDSRNDGYLSSI